MLKAVAFGLERAASLCRSSACALEGASALRGVAALPNLAPRRGYSGQDAPKDTAESRSNDSAAADSPGTSEPPAARSQTKDWRSWIDTKLNSTLAANALPSATAARANTGSSAAAGPGTAEAAAGQPAAAAPPPSRGKRMRGLRLEQEIYSIVAAAPSTPDAEEAGLPEGVTNYGQLGMASDAPRFERAAYNADATSPQRLHPSRIFYPRQIYSPAELDPYKEAEAAHDFDAVAPPPFSPDEVTRLADYKNAPLLAAFLSATGKLPRRASTGLRAKLHRRYCRQVKIARIMGVLSPTERWEPPYKAAGPRGRPGGGPR